MNPKLKEIITPKSILYHLILLQGMEWNLPMPE